MEFFSRVLADFHINRYPCLSADRQAIGFICHHTRISLPLAVYRLYQVWIERDMLRVERVIPDAAIAEFRNLMK